MLHEFTLDVPETTVALPGPGSYYTRTRAIDPDGFVGSYTPVQKIVIPALESRAFPWWILTPLLFLL